jgi:hypothetical protein
VAAAPVVRLFTFRPSRPAFDNVIRDWIVPAIRSRSGLIDVYAGRHGPDELGPRLVVSVWETRAAMDGAFAGSGRANRPAPEGLPGIEDGLVEIVSAAVAFRAREAVEPTRIIRIFRGCTQPGELDRYIEETRSGVTEDVEAGHGPICFYLAAGTAPDGFVAVSAWADWAAIELATGGDIRRPVATRRPELIVSYDATHYEAIDL